MIAGLLLHIAKCSKKEQDILNVNGHFYKFSIHDNKLFSLDFLANVNSPCQEYVDTTFFVTFPVS